MRRRKRSAGRIGRRGDRSGTRLTRVLTRWVHHLLDESGAP